LEDGGNAPVVSKARVVSVVPDGSLIRVWQYRLTGLVMSRLKGRGGYQVAHRPSPDSLFREPIIGIYDSEGIISSRLVASAPPNQILRVPPSGESDGQSLGQFFANKALFLEMAMTLLLF